MSILWKLEQDYKDELENAKSRAMYDDLTIRELLDLGFNNNWLILPNGNEFELGWVDKDGEYSDELTNEQMNIHVYMKEDFGWYDDEDEDEDGYHIAKVYLSNEEDERYFVASDDE